MDSRLKFAFLASHAQLVRRLKHSSVLPYLVSVYVVTPEEKERIQNEASSELRVDKLLTVVHRRGVNDPAIYSRLLSVLKDPEATSGQNLQEIVKKIEEDSRNEDIQERFAEASDVAALKKHEPAILSVDVHHAGPEPAILDWYGHPTDGISERSSPARGVWGHAPPGKFDIFRSFLVRSKSVLAVSP